MKSLSLALAELEISFNNHLSEAAWQIAVAGGRAPESGWLKKLAENRPILCADKGIEAVLEENLVPKALFGDGDSGSSQCYAKAEALGVNINRFPREKDATDLQLLLEQLEPRNLCITGVWGGRFDHLYSNVFSLLNWSKKSGKKVVMADHKEIMVLLSVGDEIIIELKKNYLPKALSILNFSSEVQVDFEGVHWPLREAKLEYLKPYAISNEAISNKIKCRCHKGDLGIYICLKE